MPQLDVSDILTDPDFYDRLRCERSPESVSDGGLMVIEPTRPPLECFAGVVTNDRGAILRREAQGDRIEGAITVVTRFRLTDGKLGRNGKQVAADVVHWNERRYTVVNVADYTRYGRGFVQASCELIELSGGRQDD